jgi:hypothetical protein
MPGQIGPGRRWETPFINLLVDAADAEIREYCDLSYKTQDVSLSDGVVEYELNDDCIAIYSVEWATDGSTYDTKLEAVSFDDLDATSRLWRDDGGSEPSQYTVTSTPGVPTLTGLSGATCSTIIIYPKVATVGSAVMRVRYLCTGGTTGSASQFAIDNVYVPYIRAILAAPSSDQKQAAIASGFYEQYLAGRDQLKRSAGREYSANLWGQR